jgi:hypothetical protein
MIFVPTLHLIEKKIIGVSDAAKGGGGGGGPH